MQKLLRGSKAICLIGIDGSGKTTHALKIIECLREYHKKSKYVWLGEPYFFSYPFMAICKVLGLTHLYRLQNDVTCSEHQYYRNKPIALIWPWIQFIDLAIIVNLQVCLPLLLGFTVVCDRFVQDALVGLMIDTSNSNLQNTIVGRLILKAVSRNSMVLMLDIDAAVAFRRKNDVPNLRYLAVRRKIYHLLAESSDISLVNANQQTSVIDSEITRQMKLRLDIGKPFY